MAKQTINNTGVTITLNLEGFDKYLNDLKYLANSDILQRASFHLQEQAFLAMKRKYFQTKSNRIYYNKKYLSKGKKNRIEARLFEGNLPVPVRKGKYSISFKFWPGYSALSRDLPHLRWQEEGTAKVVDTQPYLVISNKSLGPITKRRAQNRAVISTRKRKSYARKDIGGIVELRVPHPNLPARGFIAAGNLYIKSRGAKEFTNFIREELRKRNA